MPEKLCQICLHLNGDHMLLICHLSTLTNLGFDTVQKGLRKVMELHKHPAQWVQHELNAQQCQCHVDICNQLLHIRTRNRDLTNQIIIGDESWILSSMILQQSRPPPHGCAKRSATQPRHAQICKSPDSCLSAYLTHAELFTGSLLSMVWALLQLSVWGS